MSRLSVIVPASGSPPTLGVCVAALHASLKAGDELLVVDAHDVGAGHRDSPALLRNHGARQASGDVLVFVDADVVVAADALDRLRGAFDASSSLVAAFGAYDDDPPGGTVSRFRNLLHHHVHRQSAGRAQTFWAGLGAVRRKPFLAIGGFDGKRFSGPTVEDVELGMRLRAAGGEIVLLPDVTGRHLKTWTLGSMLWADFRRRGVPWTSILLERRVLPTTLNLAWRHRLSALLVGALPLLLCRRRPIASVTFGVAGLGLLNRRFYVLLARTGGPRFALAGIVLHALHHAAALASVPWGVAAHVLRKPAPQPAPLISLSRNAPAGTGGDG